MDARGFTLIELSIVLVIIGLLVGGVLVGQDLIKAAQIRAQVSQFNEYTTAIRTFQLKYGNLPGDMPPPQASMFSFVDRTGSTGCGDRNGYIGSFWVSDTNSFLDFTDFGHFGTCRSNSNSTDESIILWRDLAQSGLIKDGNLNTPVGSFLSEIAETFFPKAKLNNTFIHIGNGGMEENADPLGYTLYGWPNAQNLQSESAGLFPSISPLDSFSIDSKMDDGDPLSGIVYTLEGTPGFGTGPGKGIAAGCALDNGDGTGSYDLSSDAPACVIKVLVK